MRYDLNLAPRPFVNQAIAKTLLALLGLAALALTIVNAVILLSPSDVAGGGEERIRAAEANLDEMLTYSQEVREALDNVDYSQLSTRIDYANGLIGQRALNWSRLFDRLEELTPERMRMLRISPTARGEGIVLGLLIEAQQNEQVRLFLRALEQSPYFLDVMPRNQAQNTDGSGLQWQLEMTYLDY